jgi:hypothetical protein
MLLADEFEDPEDDRNTQFPYIRLFTCLFKGLAADWWAHQIRHSAHNGALREPHTITSDDGVAWDHDDRHITHVETDFALFKRNFHREYITNFQELSLGPSHNWREGKQRVGESADLYLRRIYQEIEFFTDKDNRLPERLQLAPYRRLHDATCNYLSAHFRCRTAQAAAAIVAQGAHASNIRRGALAFNVYRSSYATMVYKAIRFEIRETGIDPPPFDYSSIQGTMITRTGEKKPFRTRDYLPQDKQYLFTPSWLGHTKTSTRTRQAIQPPSEDEEDMPHEQLDTRQHLGRQRERRSLAFVTQWYQAPSQFQTLDGADTISRASYSGDDSTSLTDSAVSTTSTISMNSAPGLVSSHNSDEEHTGKDDAGRRTPRHRKFTKEEARRFNDMSRK